MRGDLRPRWSDSRGIPYAPRETRCEVTCRRCYGTFEVMRLRKGRLRCPHCGRIQGTTVEDVMWRKVQCQ